VGGMKSLSSEEGEKRYTDVLPFLVEDTSKMFIQRMFETLINIMKTAKITAQNNKVVKLTQNTGRVRDFEHDGIEDESASEKESPREEMKDEASASEGEYESEYESSADEQAGLPPSSSRYSFYDQLQNPNVDLNEVLANLKLQREVKVQEKKQLLNKLS
jgi:hypothetical protein